MNRLVPLLRFLSRVVKALPFAGLVIARAFVCGIRAALVILLVALVPAPLSAASLVGLVRSRSGLAGGDNPSGGTGGMSVDSATATLLGEIQSQKLSRTSAALQAALAAQQAARAAALSSAGGVANGLVPGGLVQASPNEPGYVWQGANAPTQTIQNGQTTVDIKQTAPNATLTWDEFNVGSNTILDFDQQGNSSWVVVNNVTNVHDAPSQILGQIKADGSVYVVNHNGVIFGVNSQVNAASLVAPGAFYLSINGTETVTENNAEVGGLVPASGATADSTLWQGAALPTYTTKNGQTTVDVNQTQSTAILTWDQFNVGLNTTLIFNQQGNSSWVVVNNVTDASASPSYILGQIDAAGSVYVVNRNGVIFGATSQVYVATLVASALPINTSLLNAGTFFSNPDDSFNFTAYSDQGGSIGPTAPFTAPTATTNSQDSSVIVQQGAQISTPTNAEHDGGHVILVGPEVENDGEISTPDGQTILAAGQQVALMPHSSSDTSIRGFDVYVGAIMAPVVGVDSPSTSITGDVSVISGPNNTPPPGNDPTPTGDVTNTGIITADRGNITVTGGAVSQGGFLGSTTSVSLNGSILLEAQYSASKSQGSTTLTFMETGLVTLGANSVIQVLPELDSTEEITGSQLANRSEVTVIGSTVDLGTDSSIIASNGQVTIEAGSYTGGSGSVFTYSSGQIYCDAGSVIDVSGSVVQSSVSQNIVAAQLEDAQLEDSPLQRNTFLHGATVYVDITQTGEYDGTDWIGTPLADVSQYAGGIERTVGELTTNGGTVSMSAGYSIVMQQGSSINVSNGAVDYLGGMVPTTRLVGADGNIYDISQATPNLVYTGFAGSYTVDHAKWGVTDTYTSPLISTEAYEQGYIEGGNGGSISLQAPAMLLSGNLYGATVAGERQRTASTLPIASSLTINLEGATATNPTLLPADNALGSAQNVIFSTSESGQPVPAFGSNELAADLSFMTTQTEPTVQIYLPASIVGPQGFGVVGITDGNGDIAVESPLTGTLGGSLSLIGKDISLDANITIPSAGLASSPVLTSDGGSIPNGLTCSTIDIEPSWPATNQGSTNPPTVSNRGTLTVESGVTLSAAGLLTDAFDNSNAGPTPLIVNGGSISLSGFCLDLQGANAQLQEPASVINVSGGATINSDGSVVKGSGGSVALSGGEAHTISSGEIDGIGVDNAGSVTIQSSLLGYSLGMGGSLSLTAPAIQVGGTPAANSDSLFLTSAFFNQGGFASFTLNGTGPSQYAATGLVAAIDIVGTSIAPTEIAPAVENYVLTKGDSGTFSLVPELLSPSLRCAVSLTLNGDGSPNATAGHGLGGVVLEEYASIDLAPTEQGTGSLTINDGSVANGSAAILGHVSVPGGTITINGNYNDDTAIAETNVLLAPGSVISAPGTTLLVPDAYDRQIGTVLNGGKITISGNVFAEAGSVIDVSGAAGWLDMAETLDTPESKDQLTKIDSNGGSITFKGSEDLYIAATLNGAAGGPSATGGTLRVSSGNLNPSASNYLDLVVSPVRPQLSGQQPLGLAAIGQSILDSNNNPLQLGYFSVDEFEGRGFASLVLGGNIEFSGAVKIKAAESITVATGDVIAADPTVNTTVSLSAPYVAIGSSYAAPLLDSNTNLPVIAPVTIAYPSGDETLYAIVNPTYGNGVLNINARTLIDVGYLALQNIGSADLEVPNGDIRGYGTFAVQGDITLHAGQIYPTTDGEFTIAAFDPSSTNTGLVKIEGGSARALPLSACGDINIFATTIMQNGVLRAPFGQITLGSTTPQTPDASLVNQGEDMAINGTLSAFATTVSLTLGANSVTSVSGAGLVVPYGTEVNGSDWYDPLGNNITTGGLPAKIVNVQGTNVAIDKGATIDLRGGGELVAYNWVEGLGGENDILDTTTSYAVVPSYGLGYAPLTSVMTESSSGTPTAQGGWSDSLAVGEQIWLAASNGLPAGYYTLLPARYALLPGAYLVTFQPGTAGNGTATASISEPVGSSMVSGYENNSLNPVQLQPSALGTYEVDSNALVHTFAEYDVYSADATLKSGATNAGLTAPRLPIDAGQLVLSAVPRATTTASLTIQGQVLSRTPAGGLGAMVDISTPSNIEINDTGSGSAADTLYLSADSLSAFGAESLLIGGIRDTTSAGTIVNVTTGNITVANDSSNILSGPEIILAATGNITVDPNADIKQVGTLSSPAQSLQIGNSSTANSGNGSLLRISSDDTAAITRASVTPGETTNSDGSITTHDITIGNSATISGNSVILDSTGEGNFSSSANLSAESLTLGSGQICLVEPTVPQDEQPPAGSGLVLPTTIISSLQNNLRNSNGSLTLQSYGSIDLYGTGAIGTLNADGIPTIKNLTLNSGGIRGFYTDGDTDTNGYGGTVTFNVQNLTINNTSGIAAVTGGNNELNDTLVFNSQTVNIGTGAFNITSYGTVNVGAATGVLLMGNGSLSTAGDLALNTSLVAVGADAKVTLAAGVGTSVGGAAGILSVGMATASPATGATGGSSTPTAGRGGSLELDGNAVDINTYGVIEAPSGEVTLHASGPQPTQAGGISDVNVGGTIDVSGQKDQFYDQTSYTNGGTVTLESDFNSVSVTGEVNVSAQAGGGNAGTLTVSAINGSFTATGQLIGTAPKGVSGGFTADLGYAPSVTVNGQPEPELDPITSVLNTGGFEDALSFRIRSGDVFINNTVTASSFSLSTDGGQITVNGEINASNANGPGGQISLYGYNGVTLAAGSVLTAAGTTLDNAGKGGSIDIETGQAELINGVMTAGSGWIDIEGAQNGKPAADIELGVAGGAGGTLTLCAPQVQVDPLTGKILLDANGNPIPTGVITVDTTGTPAPATVGGDVAIEPLNGTIHGASSVVVVGVQTFDLTNGGGSITQAVQNAVKDNGAAFAGGVNSAGVTVTGYTSQITNRLLNGTPNATSLSSIFNVEPGEELVSRAVQSMMVTGGDVVNLATGAQVLFSSAVSTGGITFNVPVIYTNPSGVTQHYVANAQFSIAAGGSVTLCGAGKMTSSASNSTGVGVSIDGEMTTVASGSPGSSTTFSVSNGQLFTLNSNGGTLTLPSNATISFTGTPQAGDMVTFSEPGTLTIPSGATALETVPVGTVLGSLNGVTFTLPSNDTLTASGVSFHVGSGGVGTTGVTLSNGYSIKPPVGTTQVFTLSAAGDSISVSAGASNTTFKPSVAGEIVSSGGTELSSFGVNQVIYYSSLPSGARIALSGPGTITYVVGNTAGTITFQGANNDTATLSLPATTAYVGTYVLTGLITSLASNTTLTTSVSGVNGTFTLEGSAAAQQTLTGGGTGYNIATGMTISGLSAGTTFQESTTAGTLSVSTGAPTPDTLAFSLTAGNNYTATGVVGLTPNGDMSLTSDWDFSTYRFGPSVSSSVVGSGEPGVLILRSEGNMILQGSLSDGFTAASSSLPAPYNALSSYAGELWEDVLLPPNSQSWSYRLAAGADLSGADFHDVQPLAELPSGEGSLMLGKTCPGATSSSSATTASAIVVNGISYYQVIRTGVGDIDISAGRDVQLLNQFATIYTAGSQVIPGGGTLEGSISVSNLQAITFPNGTGEETIYAQLNNGQSGQIGTIVSSVSLSDGGSTGTLPEGTVFTMLGSQSLGTSTAYRVIPTGITTGLVLPSAGAKLNLGGNGSSSGSSISGFNPGNQVAVLTTLPAGTLEVNQTCTLTQTINGVVSTTIITASPQQPALLPAIAGNSQGTTFITLTNGGTITQYAANNNTVLSLPAGSFTLISNVTPNPSKLASNSPYFSYLPAGSQLSPQDATGGGIYTGSNNTPVTTIVEVSEPLEAGSANTYTLLPGSKVTLDGAGTITLEGSQSVAVSGNGVTGYLFDLPNTTLGTGQTSAAPAYLPQYSTGGGNVTITAQEDIIHLSEPNSTDYDSEQQLPVDWLYRRGQTQNGKFIASYNGDMASTTWWVDFSNFFEGVGALGGGNVTLTAGRDVYNVDAVIPTNAWVPYATVTASGVDKSAADQPLFEYSGGSLVVTAGRNINGGVYYVEGNGDPQALNGDPQAPATGILTAGGQILTNDTRTESASAVPNASTGAAAVYSSDPLTWLPTTLFVGDASFEVSANDDVNLGEALNVFLLPQGLGNSDLLRSYFQTYNLGTSVTQPQPSSISVDSLTGNLTLYGETVSAGTPSGLEAWFSNVLAGGVSATRPWLRLSEPASSESLQSTMTNGVWTGLISSSTPIYTRYATALELFPPTLNATAFGGNIDLVGSIALAPSPTGNVDLLAAGSIAGFQQISNAYNSDTHVNGIYETASINLSDANPDALPTVGYYGPNGSPVDTPLPITYSAFTVAMPENYLTSLSPLMTAIDVFFAETGGNPGAIEEQNLNDPEPLHAADTPPARLYAQTDNISGVQLFTPKETQVIAGNDIEDIAFYLQNINKSDVSEVIAGHDLIPFDETSAARLETLGSNVSNYDSAYGAWSPLPGDIEIGGPGTLEVLAGRNLNLGGAPTTSVLAGAFESEGVGLGILSLGDSRNPYLPNNDGADIIAAAGLGKVTGAGLAGGNADFSAFISDFLNPDSAEALRYLPDLAPLMGLGGHSDAEVWKKFQALGAEQQDDLALDIFYLVLRDAGRDYNNPNAANYHSYKAGYEAIAALFHGNKWNGNMSLTSREIKTSNNGNINLLVPGGQIVVGYQAGNTKALDQGIMTTDGGNISIFADGDVSVGISRIFTFKGGNEIIWSTVGNIDAGNGSKTEQAAPPAQFLINPVNGMQTIDLSGLATGAGIGVLETMPGVPPADIDLIAPVGIVNAGDAGIRVSGNLNIAAAVVLNAANIQVQGNATGVPVVAAPNIGAITMANNTSGAATSAAQAASESQNSNSAQQPPSIYQVQVIGYGMFNDDSSEKKKDHSQDGHEHTSQVPTGSAQVNFAGLDR